LVRVLQHAGEAARVRTCLLANTRPGLLTPARLAVLAAGCAMATAAILVALFTSITIASWPHQVPQQFGGHLPHL
jgi:hypothetical protein